MVLSCMRALLQSCAGLTPLPAAQGWQQRQQPPSAGGLVAVRRGGLRLHQLCGEGHLKWHLYDQGGSNYHIPLTGSVAMMSIDEQIPDAELPDLPGELCGIWSYIKWEQAGCPNRSEEQSQAAFHEAIAVSQPFQHHFQQSPSSHQAFFEAAFAGVVLLFHCASSISPQVC